MKSEMRVQVLVAVVALPMSMLAAYAVSDSASDSLASARELCLDRRHGGAVGGDVHRARQGADPSALRELPSGRRPPAPGRQGRLHQPPVERGADGHGLAAMRCSICHQQANFDPGRVPGNPNGISHRVKWRGKARRSVRSAPRSRIPRAMATAHWKTLVHHIGDRHSGRLGLGARVRPPARSRHAEASGRARRSLGENRSSVSELEAHARSGP